MKKTEIFKANPNMDCFFETTDGNAFYTESAAKNHAKTLKDKKVTKHTRSAEEASDKGTAATKIKELESLELTMQNYKTMKEMVKYFKLDVADQKAETFIKVLEEYKQKLADK